MKKILKITYLQMGKILVWIHQVVKKIFKRDYLQVVKNLGVDSSNGEKFCMNSSSGVKILVWVHQVAIVLLNLD
jgi:hypothetical protein